MLHGQLVLSIRRQVSHVLAAGSCCASCARSRSHSSRDAASSRASSSAGGFLLAAACTAHAHTSHACNDACSARTLCGPFV